MRLAAWVVLCVFLAGCVAMPSRTQPWCYPKVKYKRDKGEVYAGIACQF